MFTDDVSLLSNHANKFAVAAKQEAITEVAEWSQSFKRTPNARQVLDRLLNL